MPGEPVSVSLAGFGQVCWQPSEIHLTCLDDFLEQSVTCVEWVFVGMWGQDWCRYLHRRSCSGRCCWHHVLLSEYILWLQRRILTAKWHLGLGARLCNNPLCLPGVQVQTITNNLRHICKLSAWRAQTRICATMEKITCPATVFKLFLGCKLMQVLFWVQFPQQISERDHAGLLCRKSRRRIAYRSDQCMER